MKNFGEYLDEQRRLLTLQALGNVAAGERVAAVVLHRYLLSIELKPSTTQVENDLLHLEALRLVERTVKDGVTLALITPAGRDVAAGRATAPGVADLVVR